MALEQRRASHVTVAMNTEEVRKLDKLARIHQCSASEIVRRAVAEKYDREKR